MEFFPEVAKVEYAGPESRDVLAYRWYNKEEVVMGKKMKEWLRFSVCFWHTFRGNGSDPFGKPTITHRFAGDDGSDTMENALRRVEAAFELFVKLGVEFYSFHDVDVAPEGKTLKETNENLDKITDRMLELQQETGVKLLWGTANLFSHPRYMNGGSTNPDPKVFVRAAAQVKKAIDVTHKLGGEGFVFWGGREGYMHILNTDMVREMNHYAKMLKMAIAYKKKIGFGGQILVEPKPREPMKHQYDYDVQTVIGFLRQHGLENEVSLNVEPNHTQLAGHEFEHDVVLAAQLGMLGSVDANTGSESLGWDTDEFITDQTRATVLCKAIIEMGGFVQGGLNFDAKVRRESTDPEDLFIAHVASIDALAKGLRNASQLVSDGRMRKMLQDRYAGWDEGIGQKIEIGETSLEDLEAHCLQDDTEPVKTSAKQEKFLAVLNHYIS
uniref:Xylose isomerase n=1 Tax=Thraustochytrium sp. ONC-T18 TaxID=370834 RepID=A0A385ZBK6_9STRA|nr:xylose isomerase [Thraustochytrium sp. ONC-T18]